MNDNKICAYKSPDNELCIKPAIGFFCKRHKYCESVVDPNNIIFCELCQVVVTTKMGLLCVTNKKCKKCINKKICKGVTQLNTPCKFQVLDEDDYCNLHQNYKKWKFLTDNGTNICPNWIRGCWSESDNNSPYCVNCHDLSAKRIKKHVDTLEYANEFNIMTSGFKMCTKCNNILPNKELNINDLCGCCDKMMQINVDNYIQDNLFENKYNSYVYGAKIRNLDFNLTKVDCLKMFSKKCFYCGFNDKTKYNGIDRMNSNLNYIPSNCVPCCTTCNMMKGTIKSNDFIQICSHIATFNKKFDGKLNFELFQSAKSPSYSSYNYGASIRNLEFNLNKNEFMNIILMPCYYCGSKNQTTCGICAGGIDRKNANLGYSIDNCVPCCKTCNIMKGTHNEINFVDICVNIAQHKQSYQQYNIENELVEAFYNTLDSNYMYDKPTFLHSKDYYDKRIWTGTLENLKNVKIGLEFVENKDQKDIWNYYRYTVSSLKTFKLNNFVGRVICILVKDLESRKYLGIISLSSDIAHLKARDVYIGWSDNNKFKEHRLNQILNMTTCVSLQPFGYNFNGGKLLVRLAFSKEVMNYFFNKYNQHLLGIITTGLYGKSVQYDRLKELKFIGYTSENSVYKISPHITKLCRDFLLLKHNKNTNNYTKLHVISTALQKLNLSRDVFMSDNPKGIYFGYTYENAKQILCGADIDVTINKQLTGHQIFDEWYDRWAIQRYTHLSTNNLIKTIVIKTSTQYVNHFREKLKETMGVDTYVKLVKENNKEYYEKNKETIKQKNQNKKTNNKITSNIVINEQTSVIKPNLPPNVSLYREKNSYMYIQYNKYIKDARIYAKHKITTNDIQYELDKLIETINTRYPDNKVAQYVINNADVWNKNNIIVKTVAETNPMPLNPTDIKKPVMPTNFSICRINDIDYIQFCKKIDNKKCQYKTKINSYNLKSELDQFITQLNTKYDFGLNSNDYPIVNNDNWKTTNTIIDHVDTPEKVANRAKALKSIAKKKELVGIDTFHAQKADYAKKYRNKKKEHIEV